MLQMDINQCDDDYFIPNAFKNTHKCDRKTSYVSSFEEPRQRADFDSKHSLFQCVPIQGRLFQTGGYKCECLQGYEYPFEDLITYYDGQLVEAEFENIVLDKESRYDLYQCRLAGAGALKSAAITISISAFLLYLYSAYSTHRRN